ncbi:heat stress transcription factor A-7a-like protein [Tanacetum coccineum]|uniref:Heat stress transcription factor A-7a-like protein n=1 Tax=Tanacetum coccineum TaxID=301880 RepID=A0ABQ4ZG82_9ASTR
MVQFEKEQEPSNSSVGVGGLIQSYLPFMIPNLKLLSKSPNRSFVYKLFDMVSDPSTDAIILWSKSGTSFFIKDKEGLHNHVQERFDHNIKTFHKTLGEFGFQCIDKFLHEYANKNFQRDNKAMLKNIKSRRKLWLAKNNMQSDMEEEVKRLKFFQDSLKVNISNMKEKAQITKCLLDVKRCLESASMRIATKVNEKKRLEQDQVKYSIPKGIEKVAARKDGRRPWSDPMQVYVDIEKLQKDLSKLNVQILNLEQGQVFIEDQLAAIEKNLPGTEIKQQEVEVSMNKLFNNSKAIPRKRSRKNANKKKHESGVKKVRANDSNDQTGTEDSTRNLESRESDSPVYYPKENDSSSATDLEHEDLMLFVGMLEDDLTCESDSPVYYPKENDSSSATYLEHEDLMLFVGMLDDDLTFSW